MYKELRKKISDAELILVGIGEEFEVKRDEMERNAVYARAFSKYEGEECLFPFIEKHFLEKSNDEAVLVRKNAYHCLAELLRGKNYFVVTLCTDSLIHGVGLDENRITKPCGNREKMQCCDKCTSELYDRKAEALALGESILSGEGREGGFSLPVCPVCGKALVFNNISAENYAEEGYLDSWTTYRKWLQGTVNRKVCVMELGVGMRFPSVIRWPFEKVVYFNRKAFLLRVHSRLYQTAEEIKERSVGIESSALTFLKLLYNET